MTLAALVLWASAAFSSGPEFIKALLEAAQSDVVIVGEVHDNPHHHFIQAQFASTLAPRAIVFEMLRPEDVAVIADHASVDALSDALAWSDRGWPALHHYYQIIEAAPDAMILGAELPASDISAAVESSAATVFKGDAARFALDRPLDVAQRAVRESRQLAAHCHALPADLLPGMVEVQRLRDAVLAEAALIGERADGSGPVLVITGNGHADRDWGVPAALAAAAPELSVYIVEQSEAPVPSSNADMVLIGIPVDRPDPCAAFEK